MPTITNYTTLGQAIQDFSHRSSLASYVDYFIQCAQEDIERDVLTENMGEGIRAMEVAFPLTSMAQTEDGEMVVPVPSDLIGIKVMKLHAPSGCVGTLYLKPVEWIYDRYSRRMSGGPPKYMARSRLLTGTQLTIDSQTITVDSQTTTVDTINEGFVFGPYPDQIYSISGTYYASAPLLSSIVPTNWMVTYAPLLMLAACMVHAARFLKDMGAIQMWQQDYGARLEKLINADKAQRYSSGTMSVSAA